MSEELQELMVHVAPRGNCTDLCAVISRQSGLWKLTARLTISTKQEPLILGEDVDLSQWTRQLQGKVVVKNIFGVDGGVVLLVESDGQISIAKELLT
jgi:hypothetical protein